MDARHAEFPPQAIEMEVGHDDDAWLGTESAFISLLAVPSSAELPSKRMKSFL